nr:DUF3054 family protein [Acidimicrobiia bacterium]
ILGVAAPFLIGLAAGWLAWVPARRAPITITTGAVVAAATVIVGLVLRRVAWDRGVALSFAIVTALVLGGFFIGWRALWGVGRRDRRRVSEI